MNTGASFPEIPAPIRGAQAERFEPIMGLSMAAGAPAPQVPAPQASAPLLHAALAERFEPLMALAMHARGTPAGRAAPWAEVAARMHALADAEAARPLPEGLAEEDMEACRMAVYTFVDEILLASPRPDETDGTGWYAHGLQIARLGAANGGELFYRRLWELTGRAVDPHGGNAPGHVREDGVALLRTPQGDGLPHAPRQGDGLRDAVRRPDMAPGPFRAPAPAVQAAGMAAWMGGMTGAGMPGIGSDMAGRGRDNELAHLPARLDALRPDQPAGPAASSALAAAGVFALCLLYGFRGRLYDSAHARLADEMTGAAAGLLARMALAVPPARLSQPAGQDAPAGTRFGPLRHPAIWLLLPVALTGLWYLVCAEIVANIPLP